MKRIIVLGSYNIGLTIIGKRMPQPGETVLGRHFDAGPGGKGSNQAIAIRRLGGNVTLVARVGNDTFGRDALKLFRTERLPTRYITVDGQQPTGAALIFVDGQGQNAISVALGANLALDTTDVDRAEQLFEPGAILLMQLESPITVMHEAARRARKAGMTVILNPAPAQALKPAFLRLCDYLTPNETEASELSGIPVTDLKSAEQAARKLLASGPRRVLVTLGKKGALLVSADWVLHTPAPKVRALDSTGAGDAFNGGFAYALAAGMTEQDAVRLATRVGSFCVTRLGVIPGLPTQAELSASAAP
jgi:ribokinase